ncbi:hypothetical protein KKC91_02410 [bacterium]|nr:hypothetical protein [bacterium]
MKIFFSIIFLFISALTYAEVNSSETSMPEIAVFQKPPLVKRIDKELERIQPEEAKGPNAKLTIISTWKEGTNYTVNMSIKNLNKEQGYRTVYLLSYDNDGRIVAVSSDRKYFQSYQEYFTQYKFTKSSSIIRWRFYVK